jgi:hypothetical protein
MSVVVLDTVDSSSITRVFVVVTYSVIGRISHVVIATVTVLKAVVTFVSIVIGTVIGYGMMVVAVKVP